LERKPGETTLNIEIRVKKKKREKRNHYEGSGGKKKGRGHVGLKRPCEIWEESFFLQSRGGEGERKKKKGVKNIFRKKKKKTE